MRYFALLSLGLVTSSALAQPGGPIIPSPAVVTAASGKPNPVICHKEDVIGSRLQKQRICHTKAEWDELRIRNMMNVEGRETGIHQEASGGI